MSTNVPVPNSAPLSPTPYSAYANAVNSAIQAANATNDANRATYLATSADPNNPPAGSFQEYAMKVARALSVPGSPMPSPLHPAPSIVITAIPFNQLAPPTATTGQIFATQSFGPPVCAELSLPTPPVVATAVNGVGIGHVETPGLPYYTVLAGDTTPTDPSTGYSAPIAGTSSDGVSGMFVKHVDPWGSFYTLISGTAPPAAQPITSATTAKPAATPFAGSLAGTLAGA